MPSSSALIDHLINVGNKSGVIKGGPESMKMLKENIKNIPFEYASPGVSQVFKGSNIFSILKGLMEIIEKAPKTPRGVPAAPPEN